MPDMYTSLAKAIDGFQKLHMTDGFTSIANLYDGEGNLWSLSDIKKAITENHYWRPYPDDEEHELEVIQRHHLN